MTHAGSSAPFQHLDWASVPVERVADGIVRQLVWGDRLMVCRLEIAAHVVTVPIPNS